MLRFSMSTGICAVFSLTGPLEIGLSCIHLPVTTCNSLQIERIRNYVSARRYARETKSRAMRKGYTLHFRPEFDINEVSRISFARYLAIYILLPSINKDLAKTQRDITTCNEKYSSSTYYFSTFYVIAFQNNPIFSPVLF